MKKLLLILLCLPMIGLASFPINTFFEECDNIILKDGKEISAKVIEVMIIMYLWLVVCVMNLNKWQSCGYHII